MTHDASRQLEDTYRYQADAVRRSLARKVGHDAAEDIVGRAFVRLAEKLEAAPVKDAPALLGTIVSGLLIDHYRARDTRRAREVATDFADAERKAAVPVEEMYEGYDPRSFDEARKVVDAITVPPADLEDVEFRHDFDLALRSLDDEERDAYILTELRGLTEREAAAVLGTSQPTVHRRAEAARTIIRKELIAA